MRPGRERFRLRHDRRRASWNAYAGGRAQADFDSDGVLERFHVCASFEGVHFSIWSGVPLHGTQRWERYFYVPYDTEPTCEDIDSLEIRKWRGE